MSGEDDSIVPVLNARIMASLIPHAQRHVFAGRQVDIIAAAAELAPRINHFLT